MSDEQDGPRFRAVVSAEWTVRGPITDTAYGEVLGRARELAHAQSGDPPPIVIEGSEEGITVAVRLTDQLYDHRPKITPDPPLVTRDGGSDRLSDRPVTR